MPAVSGWGRDAFLGSRHRKKWAAGHGESSAYGGRADPSGLSCDPRPSRQNVAPGNDPCPGTGGGLLPGNATARVAATPWLMRNEFRYPAGALSLLHGKPAHGATAIGFRANAAVSGRNQPDAAAGGKRLSHAPGRGCVGPLLADASVSTNACAATGIAGNFSRLAP